MGLRDRVACYSIPMTVSPLNNTVINTYVMAWQAEDLKN